MTQAPWLESVDLLGPNRDFPGARLRYHPVVPESRLKLSVVPTVREGQQLLLEHRAQGQLISSEVVGLQAGRLEWPVELLRGWNRLRVVVPGHSHRVFVLDVLHRTELREWVETLVYALAFALLIRTFLVQVFVLPIDSQLEQLLAGDRILVNRAHYLLTAPKQGDLAILEHAPGGSARFVVRRVAATPGHSVETSGVTIRVDGSPLGEPFSSLASSPIPTESLPVAVPLLQVPDQAYFVVGSTPDTKGRVSCHWGFHDSRAILGHATALFWPWDRRRWIR